jgi:hypothetical protein
MNFYFDMMNIFSADHDRRKIAIIAHGISDMWGMPAKGDVCTSFTYGVTSEVLVAPMSERLGVPLYVTPNGVDPSDYSYRERNGVVTTVGWCGSEALEIKRVSWAKEIAASVGLELRVAATVPREEMAAWYNSIDLLLVTSGPDVTAESGPLPPFEAIVSGVPVIGVPCGNFSFLPGPKFSTVEEGVALIRSLIASPDQVKSLADEQRDCVLRRWTYNAVANQWRSLFEITTSKHKDSRMIAVTMYGGFRSFELNLRRNIEEVLGEVKGPVHFYILTEHCADYDAKKQAVVDIIQSYGYEIKYFEHVGESSHYKKEEEDAMYADYYAIPYNGIRDDFTPKLFYRRCLINKIMNSVGIPYDKVVCARMFDIIVKRFKSLSFINDPTDATLYYSVDTIIIGRMKDLNTMFAMNKISDIIQIPETDQGRFWAFYDRNDRCLASIKPKLASETIYQSILFKHFLERSVNLRYDFTRHDTDVWAANNRSKDAAIICDLATNYVKDDYLFVLLDPNRR